MNERDYPELYMHEESWAITVFIDDATKFLRIQLFNLLESNIVVYYTTTAKRGWNTFFAEYPLSTTKDLPGYSGRVDIKESTAQRLLKIKQ